MRCERTSNAPFSEMTAPRATAPRSAIWLLLRSSTARVRLLVRPCANAAASRSPKPLLLSTSFFSWLSRGANDVASSVQVDRRHAFSVMSKASMCVQVRSRQATAAPPQSCMPLSARSSDVTHALTCTMQRIDGHSHYCGAHIALQVDWDLDGTERLYIDCKYRGIGSQGCRALVCIP